MILAYEAGAGSVPGHVICLVVISVTLESLHVSSPSHRANTGPEAVIVSSHSMLLSGQHESVQLALFTPYITPSIYIKDIRSQW